MKPIYSLKLAIALILLTIPFSSCTPNLETKPEKQDLSKPRLVGRVASISSEKSFILIQSYGKWDITSGTILSSAGPEGRAANLLVTGEKHGQFAAADIKSGELEIGDGVYTTLSKEKVIP